MTADPLDLKAQAENPADLLPILAASIVEYDSGMVFIKHPFVNELYFGPALHARYNAQFEYKQKATAKACADRQWHAVVFITERPWRFERLLDIADEMTDAEFWTLVSDVWQDSENIRENQDEWDELLRTDRPGREHMMTDEERAALAALPDRITVYQGHTDERDDGWSWTTDEATARFFARRFADFESATGIVTEAVINKSDVTAYLLGRNEFEILIDPDLVGDFVQAHVL
jgi:hypothetical protein